MTNATILVAYDNFRILLLTKSFMKQGQDRKPFRTIVDTHILVSWAFDLNYRSRGLSVSWDIGLLAQFAHLCVIM